MNKYKHIVYNPKIKSIESILREVDDTWQFSRSQPVTEYEWVAIFERWDGWADESTIDFKPTINDLLTK